MQTKVDRQITKFNSPSNFCTVYIECDAFMKLAIWLHRDLYLVHVQPLIWDELPDRNSEEISSFSLIFLSNIIPYKNQKYNIAPSFAHYNKPIILYLHACLSLLSRYLYWASKLILPCMHVSWLFITSVSSGWCLRSVKELKPN